MRPFLCMFFAALLAACTTPYRPPQFQQADTRFPGLIDFAARTPAKAADVLLVHGMCTHDERWAHETVALLANHLAAQVGQAASQRGAMPSDVLVVPSDVTTAQGTLHFRALIWSPLTTPLKQQLCYDQTDKSPICAGAPPFAAARARLNARFKDWFVDDCLPDALVYQGRARDEMQLRMRDAILRATRDADDDAPLVVIAESLGSKILFDTLLRMTEEPAGSPAAQVAMREVRRMAWLIMAANQIPLLHMADQQLEPGPAAAPAVPDSLERLLRLKQRGPAAGRRAATPLTLVAFSDPGDVLTYTLPPERYRQAGATVYNVLVSNAPTYLGLLEDPLRAHEDYLDNPDVGSLIACGMPRSGLCR